MPSSRKTVHQTVYFDSLFNFSCPSVPTAVAGSLAPPESGQAPTGTGARLSLGTLPGFNGEQQV